MEYIATFLALLLVLPIHEFAHGFAAVKSGDITPKLYKRYTLNPLAHFDLIGVLSFVLCGFGWAKPMPVNPNNFRHYKRNSFWVAIAGVLANYLLAFIIYPLVILSSGIPVYTNLIYLLQLTLQYIFILSITFFIFNLIPIYPLDGFRVVDIFSSKRSIFYRILREYGRYILLGFFALSLIAEYTNFYQLDVLGNAIRWAFGYLQIPITSFWGLIL